VTLEKSAEIDRQILLQEEQKTCVRPSSSMSIGSLSGKYRMVSASSAEYQRRQILRGDPIRRG
jgi:hypothetical protein